ncbi:MAG: hypothetical protein GY810_21910 [Aureispira sp.]|nr:hypothetical protein [Aureispira sp.]
MKALKLSGFLILAVVFVISGCRKKFDEPPVSELPVLTANATVADLLALRDLSTNIPAEVTTDLVLKGTVVGDDRSGNFYKQLVIQDATGGINISIDAYNIYNNYPVGREVWVKCKGLYVWNNNDLPSLGISLDPSASRIPEALLSEYLVGGEREKYVTPKTRTFSTLVDADLNTLVTFDEVQFDGADAGATYADPITQFSENRKVVGCTQFGEIILRSSGYSDFAGATTPTGSGKITAVYTIYNGTQQLVIRDLTDVEMEQARCGGGGTSGNGCPTCTPMDISAVRSLYAGNPVNVSASKKITGIVTSNRNTEHINEQNIIIEDASAGILIRFDAPHSFNLGDEVEVDVSNQSVETYKDLMQINGVPLAGTKVISSGNTPSTQTVTIAQINSNFADYESELITLSGVTLSGGATYSGNLTVAAGADNITLYTPSYTTFAGASVPGGSVGVTAIVSQYNGTYQLTLRDATDVTGGVAINYLLNETFSSLAPASGADLALTGWTNYAANGGTVKWLSKEYSNNQYAEARGYQTGASSIETWMITPSLNLAQDQYLSFQSAQAFHTHDGLTVWISTDFNGSNMATATWTQLTCTLAGVNDSFYDFISSGNIDLSAYTGQNAYIGFKYVGDDTNNTGTFQVDNIKVFDQ